jgi:peptidoglycan hydrolase CwlO-like protein
MKKLILVFFASLVFFTTAGYAEDQSLEDLQTQMAEIKNKLRTLQESNNDLKKTLSSHENEIDGWRAALENIETEIAVLNGVGE